MSTSIYESFINEWYKSLNDILDLNINVNKIVDEDYDDKISDLYLSLQRIKISNENYLIDQFGTIWSRDYNIVGINKELFSF